MRLASSQFCKHRHPASTSPRNFLQVVRCLFHVVVADDPLGFAEPFDFVGNVGFEIDPFKAAVGDDLADQHLSLFLGAGPTATVGGSAERRQPGAGFDFHEPFEVDRLGEEVEPQLDELRAAVDRFLQFGLNHLVTGARNDDANTIGND